MDEIVLLTSLAVFLLLAGVCSIVFNKIKLPPLVGYLFAGIIVANIWDVSEDSQTVVEILSDMGLIMLMFCIGLEINLKKIRKQGVLAMKVALVEIPFMVLFGAIFGSILGLDSLQSLCLGAVMAGSSTAVVLGVLRMQNRLEKDRIDTLILVIIMEDIAQVIILSMITPMMAGGAMDPGALAAMIVSIIAFMVVSIFLGIRFMPRIINWIADSVSSEVVVIFTVGLAFGMALLASYVGLSVAIGAFLMGMMVASSRKSRDITHDIEPMKNIFMAMFFISVGMEIRLTTLMDNLTLTLCLLVIFVVLKLIAVFLGYWFANETPKNSFTSAISFLVMGEFAFIIAKQALDYEVFSEGVYTSIVGAALLSMVLLPLISQNADGRWDAVAKRIPEKLMNMFKALDGAKTSFYSMLSDSSRRTRKEVNANITMVYILLVMITIIEIFFMLATQTIIQWGMTYFGGDLIIWSILVLLLNFFVLYVPTIRLFIRVKTMLIMANGFKNMLTSEHGLITHIFMSNAWIMAMMLDITLIIIVPNGLELWEHIVVLFIALVILLIYNLKSVRARTEMVTVFEDDDTYDVDLDEFIELMNRKYEENLERATAHKTVSIDTGDIPHDKE
jgi:CPA2 family monovalent cation:H+ antiporter-2